MNDTPDAAGMMKAMDDYTIRTNPTLRRRAALPVRLTGAETPAEPVAAAEVEGAAADDRLGRGVIFERPGGLDYGQRYQARRAATAAAATGDEA
jgi:hypothetical protein